jgi:hypothetical protein
VFASRVTDFDHELKAFVVLYLSTIGIVLKRNIVFEPGRVYRRCTDDDTF